MLFVGDALFVQLAPAAVQSCQGVVTFAWALRLVLGAAQAYYNMVCTLQLPTRLRTSGPEAVC